MYPEPPRARVLSVVTVPPNTGRNSANDDIPVTLNRQAVMVAARRSLEEPGVELRGFDAQPQC